MKYIVKYVYDLPDVEYFRKLGWKSIDTIDDVGEILFELGGDMDELRELIGSPKVYVSIDKEMA